MTAEGIVGEYLALKREADADLLAMQMGDFYEFFHEDAVTVGEELDLKVSERSSGGESYKMAGVPLDELTPYVKALVERGYRVAVADQHEVDGGHERAIARIVTPGTLLETSAADAQYLASVVREGDGYGLAFADVTTGRFQATELAGDDAATRALTELYRFDPAEVLPGPEIRADDAFLDRLRERVDATLTLHATEAFEPGRARHALRDQFGEGALAAVGIADDPAAVRAAGAVLDYVEETGTGTLASMTRLHAYGAADLVELDATTQRNLELVETMTGTGGSLFETVDHTVTSAGGRLLKEWLTRPRRGRSELDRRQAGVAALAEAALAREELREALDGAYDLERLASRAVSGSAGASALARARDTLGVVADLAEAVAAAPRLAESPVAAVLDDLDRDGVADLRAELADALAEDPPRSGAGTIRRGYDETLDEIVADHESAVEWIDALDDREAAEHDVARLTVDRNKTDGYYIQVPKSERDSVPDHYEGIKTLKNAERYVTEELNEREREIVRLEERRLERERELFAQLRERVAADAELLQDVGRALAEVDVLASFAAHAVRHDWTRPDLVEGRDLHVEAGRHPVVEQTTDFVPNDLDMDEDRRFLVVTGPNMSGKSTYMRQAALLVLLAQVGSFVPAQSARVGLVDGIYTRVGALDELAQGRSTFMVEMQELSNILHSASEDSLVVLDEVGRGTATYDGISIAWAATEYLHNEVRAKTLFATHYHELTSLADRLDRVANVHVAADERDGDVTFLRTIREGPTDRSYGIHVADLAGVPDPVVDRADEVLGRLREEKAIEARGGTNSGDSEPVQAVFDLGSGSFRQRASDGGKADDDGEAGADTALSDEQRAVLEDVADTSLNDLTPVEALTKVQEWQDELEGER
ncbi:MAG: DNA mismatch repair protein MutS [Haloarculaceae archaeon]